MAKRTVRKGKRKERKNISYGVAHIYSTFNNTIVCVSDKGGNILAWASGGAWASRERKSPFAAQIAATRSPRRSRTASGNRRGRQGPGPGRESAIRCSRRQGSR